ncbi:hypothetical protein NP493_191g01008 [Ridgeia piscesae]|uniref:Uncharacterized protein n=1 Tax=Ridgeia piscesae TaxID=27915 RepID=A0AAD9UEU1_RIDPI|nr:hypothetical protein NP493_191g01008 [Ridgeia piscesae]
MIREWMPSSLTTILCSWSSCTWIPSRNHNSSGIGRPLTTQSKRVIWPSWASRSTGIFRNFGRKCFSETPPKSREPRRDPVGLLIILRRVSGATYDVSSMIPTSSTSSWAEQASRPTRLVAQHV